LVGALNHHAAWDIQSLRSGLLSIDFHVAQQQNKSLSAIENHP